MGEIRAFQTKRDSIDGTGGPPNNSDMEKRLSSLEAIIPTLMTKSDGEALRADIHKMDASIKTWMLGTVITIIGTLLAAIFGVAQVFKGSQPATQAAQPTVIVVPSTPQTTPPPSSTSK